AKVAVERKILTQKNKVDYHPTILRFATAFGVAPRMRFDLTVNQFTRDLHLGKNLLVYDADTWRPYCHVKDFAEIIYRVLVAPVDKVSFQVFNAGGDLNNYTKRMIVNVILKYIPSGLITYRSQGQDPRNYKVNFSKMRDNLGFEPMYSIEEGVSELLSKLKDGFYDEVDKDQKFYGNYEISYP
ncbi:MAG: NAD(P)-dependent oxidoreductase, partial [Pseudomonadota bacterium]|nr:NAD(P)-dependent oxidoreductase [Pseudomonadota bacterium]